MRNLYLRFFFSFWTAMVLVLACTVAATLWLATERQEHERERQGTLARQASVVLSEHGESALNEWLVMQVSVVYPDRLYVLDSRGRDLLGRAVPEFLMATLGRRPFPAMPYPSQLRPDYRLLSQLVNPKSQEVFQLALLHQRTNRAFLLGIFATPEAPIVAALITLLASTVVCYLLARYLSAPIQHLRNATHSIADGNLEVRVSGLLGARRDELALLATDFDAMAARLRALLGSQQQLLRDVSHELRSPLARLQIALGLARRPGANLVQELDRIEQEAQRLNELIGEILSLSRLDDPAHALESEAVPAAELLDAICEDARVEADARAVEIFLQALPELELHGDRELLHRAIENVVRNAVRFAPGGSRIEVRALRQGTAVQVSVTDQGPGVPPALLTRIFEPFFRVASARERDSGGNGIGLAIAERVVSLHGGSIAASNIEPHGLCVTLILPQPIGPQEPRQTPLLTSPVVVAPASRAAA
jgi:two-component system sensor histidine kinase CpxA